MKCLSENCFWTLFVLVNFAFGDGFLSRANEEISKKTNSTIYFLTDKFHSAQPYNKLNQGFGKKPQSIVGNFSTDINKKILYNTRLSQGVDGNAIPRNHNSTTQYIITHDHRNAISNLKVKPKIPFSYENESILKNSDQSLFRKSLNTTEEYYSSEGTNTDAQYHPVPKRIYVRHKGRATNPEYAPTVLMRPVPVRKRRIIDHSLNTEDSEESHSIGERSQTDLQQHPRNSHSQVPRANKKLKKRRKRLNANRKKNQKPDESKHDTSKEAEGFKLEESAKKSSLEDSVMVTNDLGVSTEDSSVPKGASKSIDYYSILFGDHNIEEKINSKESKDIPLSTFQYNGNVYNQKPLHKLFGPPYDHYRSNYFPHHHQHSNPKPSEGDYQYKDVLVPPESVFESPFSFSTPTPPVSITVPPSFYSMSTPHVYSHRSQSLVTTSHSLQSPFNSPIPFISYIPDYNLPSQIFHHSHSIQDQRPSIFVKTDSEDSLSNSLELQNDRQKNINEEEPYFSQDFVSHKNFQTEKIFREKTHHNIVTVGKSISHHRNHNAFNGKILKAYPENIPRTSFSCSGRPPGMYADMEAECQVWHTCESDFRHHTFMCPNGTTFSQKLLTCDWWYNVNCEDTEQYLDIGPSAEVFKEIVKDKKDDRAIMIEEQSFRGKTLKQTSRGRKTNTMKAGNPSENATEEILLTTEKSVTEKENIKEGAENEHVESNGVTDEGGKETINSEEEEIPEGDLKKIKSEEEGIYFPQVTPMLPKSAVLETHQKPKLTPKFVEFIPYTGTDYPLFRLLKPGERRFLSKRQTLKPKKVSSQQML